MSLTDMPREEIERELEARRDKCAAASAALEEAGVPETVLNGDDETVWRSLTLHVRELAHTSVK